MPLDRGASMADLAASLDSVPVPVSPGEQVVARWDATDLLEIRGTSSEAERKTAELVALRAMRDTPFHTPAYQASDTDASIRVYLAREHGQAIAMAVLRPRARWAWWSWDDWDAERRPATPVAPLPSWTVEGIWVHSAARSRNLAKQLLDAAASRVDQPISSFGWRRPFTPSGEAFVRRCCPEGFWVPD